MSRDSTRERPVAWILFGGLDFVGRVEIYVLHSYSMSVCEHAARWMRPDCPTERCTVTTALEVSIVTDHESEGGHTVSCHQIPCRQRVSPENSRHLASTTRHVTSYSAGNLAL